jgi:multidrug efflux pump subunit AcrA (membrane-fusion protein)
MKIRKLVFWLLLVLVVIVGINYARISLRNAARPPQPSRTPALEASPARLYGLVEPLGREVFVGPLQARRVVQVAVAEGSPVKAGDVLVRLDADLEQRAVEIAEARLEEAVRRLAITQDELRRKRPLARDKAVPELEAARLELQASLEEQQIETARAELAARRTELEKLTLRAPVSGRVYKLDVRVGELLTPQDYERIVVGRQEQQVRLFVETFWMNGIRPEDRFRVRDSETLRDLGEGVVREISPYVGTRGFRTEDRLERLDTKFAQVVLELKAAQNLPLGLLVLCERIGT